MKQIPYGRQDINEIDIDAVIEVLKSDWITQGPTIEAFEKATAQYCRANYAVAVNSATSALHIACLAAGVGPGDVVWTSPNTFVASANCAIYCGAAVDFVDIDPLTYNLDVDKLEAKLQAASKENNLPKAIIPVHFAGQSCEMARIKELAQIYGFKVIEDASHAIGGTYKGQKIGSCEFSDMVVFSFHPVKIITSGEGGMVLTNNKDLDEKLRLLRSHGITRDERLMEDKSEGPWYYQQVGLGFNYRITDIQASLGLSQLKRIDKFVAKRHLIADTYNQELKELPITLPFQEPDAFSSFHLYVIRLQLNKINKDRRQVFEALRTAGIGVNVHYIPVHTQPFYRKLGFKPGDFPEAENYYREAISLPIYFGLSASEQQFVIAKLKEVVR